MSRAILRVLQLRNISSRARRAKKNHDPALTTQLINLMKECRQQKQYHKVIEYYSKLTHLSNTLFSSTWGLALEAMLELDLKTLFIEEFRRLKNKIPPNTYILTLLVELYIRNQDFISAMAILETMKKFPHTKPDIITYNTLLKVGQKRYGSNIQGMEEVWEMMKLQKIEPDRWSYNILLEAYTGSEDFENAKKSGKDSEEKGISPDIVTYNLLIRHELRLRGISSALIFLRDMRSARVKRDELTYHPLLNFAILNNDDFLFRRLTEIMIDDKIVFTMTTFNLVLNKILLGNHLSKVHTLFEELKKRNLKPDRDTYRYFLLYFNRTDPQIKSYAHIHLAHLNRIQSYLNPSLLSRIANNIHRKARLDANQSSPPTRLTRDSCGHLLDCRNMAQAGQLDLAFEEFNKQIDTGYLPNAQQCSTLIHYALKSKYHNLANRVFEIYEKSQTVGIVVLTSFIKYSENIQQLEVIVSYLKERNIAMDPYAIACLASRLICRRRPIKAVEILEDCENKNVEIWNTLMWGYYVLGKFTRIPECLGAIVDIDGDIGKSSEGAIRQMIRETNKNDERREFLLNIYTKVLEIKERPMKQRQRLTKAQITGFLNENINRTVKLGNNHIEQAQSRKL
ncbi:putative pentatricopeptide repeat-containing protein [Neolecta irregularis DAH-3]|uniref:Putative pentatricopeptide repeat-containing protein n=1 Tax=Neolecta irregularis (strain DAH-3) TaxID=1198029 RepID=A0A1U7LVD4_NEOID|nr:putative pentatricopeptide repeat-containing protein [Neolecta irregularis DAH-3]|eukprot:OLL26533.1 putative pentatricopeptide repeat-containing protein [Neolecta irregularis DAH-3]